MMSYIITERGISNGAVSALKVGCGKFFSRRGSDLLLAGEIMRLGRKALLVGGPTSVDRVMDAARESLDAAGVCYLRIRRHTDYCTVAWARPMPRWLGKAARS